MPCAAQQQQQQQRQQEEEGSEGRSQRAEQDPCSAAQGAAPSARQPDRAQGCGKVCAAGV